MTNSHARNIFDFSNYRRYLRFRIEEARSQGQFNLSKMAEVAQVHPTFLSHVLSGKKDLSLEQAAFISQFLKHTKLEQEYFFVIVQLERAGTTILKEYWKQKKSELEAARNRLGQRFETHKELNGEQKATYYSSWIYAAACVLTSRPDQTLDRISSRLDITREKAQEVLTFLCHSGLVAEKNGIYGLGEVHVHIDRDSPHVVRHHANWRMKAIQKMERSTPDELFFSAPMAISKEDFMLIREKLNLFVKQFVDIAKASKAEDLYCLCIDFFDVN